METSLVLLWALIVVYTLISLWLGKFSITMPIFVVLLSAVLGGSALGWIQIPVSANSVETLIEITLGLLLFADASALDFNKVREDVSLPGRLLLIVLPLVIFLGAAVAFILFPGEGIGFALLVATILAPTDAALGLPIFNNPRMPARISRALNVESGLNDGIATPLVTLFIALSLEEMTHGQGGFLFSALSQIAIGIGVGIGLGLLGGWLFAKAEKNEWATLEAMQIGNPALALLTFFLAQGLGGNSFVAVFVAGIMFGYISKHRLHEATEFTEVTGTLLSVFVWMVFGAVLVVPLFTKFNALALVYALLSLTIIRMIPVAIGLIGTRLRLDTVLMMGWLGPRGLASVVFLIMANEASREAQVPSDMLIAIISWTIFLSVILHGISALPLANWYGSRMEKANPDIAELLGVQETHVSHRRRILTLPSRKSDG